jgi:hypothetical protein
MVIRVIVVKHTAMDGANDVKPQLTTRLLTTSKTTLLGVAPPIAMETLQFIRSVAILPVSFPTKAIFTCRIGHQKHEFNHHTGISTGITGFDTNLTLFFLVLNIPSLGMFPRCRAARALDEGATLTTLGLARHDVDIGHLGSRDAGMLPGCNGCNG